MFVLLLMLQLIVLIHLPNKWHWYISIYHELFGFVIVFCFDVEML